MNYNSYRKSERRTAFISVATVSLALLFVTIAILVAPPAPEPEPEIKLDVRDIPAPAEPAPAVLVEESIVSEPEPVTEEVAYSEEYYEPVYYEEYYEPVYYGSSYNNDLQSAGVVYGDDGTRYTWYSQNVLPGGGLTELNNNGRHVNDEGFVCDGDGYISVASSDYPIGTVVETPFGEGKVYDTGCASGTIDIYTNY